MQKVELLKLSLNKTIITNFTARGSNPVGPSPGSSGSPPPRNNVSNSCGSGPRAPKEDTKKSDISMAQQEPSGSSPAPAGSGANNTQNFTRL